MGSPEDRAEDVGGIIHYEHIQLYVRVLRTCLSDTSAETCRCLPSATACCLHRARGGMPQACDHMQQCGTRPTIGQQRTQISGQKTMQA